MFKKLINHKFLNIPFYQTHWHDITVEEIVKKNGLETANINYTTLCKLFYKEFKKRGYPIKQDFLKEKEKTSEHLRAVLATLFDKPKDIKILSVGAGFGLIEEPLIHEGYKIDLQECNLESLEYIQSRERLGNNRLIVSDDLSSLLPSSYDFIWINNVTYCLNLETIKSLFSQCSVIVKKNGFVCLSSEVVYSLESLRSLYVQHNGIKWGWRRPWQLIKRIGEKAGLKLIYHKFLDDQFKERKPKTFLGFPIFSVDIASEFLFKKEQNIFKSENERTLIE